MSVTHAMLNGRDGASMRTQPVFDIGQRGWRSLPFEVRHFCPNFTRQVFSFAVPFLPLKALSTACPKNSAKTFVNATCMPKTVGGPRNRPLGPSLGFRSHI